MKISQLATDDVSCWCCKRRLEKNDPGRCNDRPEVGDGVGGSVVGTGTLTVTSNIGTFPPGLSPLLPRCLDRRLASFPPLPSLTWTYTSGSCALFLDFRRFRGFLSVGPTSIRLAPGQAGHTTRNLNSGPSTGLPPCPSRRSADEPVLYASSITVVGRRICCVWLRCRTLAVS